MPINQNVVITGACGFIGSSLSLFFKEQGYNTILIDNLKHGYLENLDPAMQSELTVADCFSEKDRIQELIPEAAVIIHLAGISSLPECESNPQYAYSHNIVALVNMLEVAVAKKASRFIFASTSALYENNTSYPFDEQQAVSPDLVYSQTKYLGEQICSSYSKNYNLDIICSRFFNVYGSKQDRKRKNPPYTAYLLNCFENNITPRVFNWTDVVRDYIYYKDLNELLLRMVEHQDNFKAEVFNLCSGFTYSTKDIYKIIEQIFGFTMAPDLQQAAAIWDKYPLKEKGFNAARIEKEVFKKSVGSNVKTKNTFEYSPKFDMETGMSDILSK